MTCERCKEREATITLVEEMPDGSTRRYDLCEACARREAPRPRP